MLTCLICTFPNAIILNWYNARIYNRLKSKNEHILGASGAWRKFCKNKIS